MDGGGNGGGGDGGSGGEGWVGWELSVWMKRWCRVEWMEYKKGTTRILYICYEDMRQMIPYYMPQGQDLVSELS